MAEEPRVTGVRLFNTLTGRVEDLVPRDPGIVRIYTCGPTVYDYTHIGHLRPALVTDTLVRHLRGRGWAVQWISNFTDVDDRIITRANAEGITPNSYAERYIRDYLENMDAVGVRAVERYARVTEHIAEIVDMVETIIRKGFAYEVDGDVYFSVQAKSDYGKLSGRSLDEMVAGARVRVDERKHHPMDFALWKAAKPGEPSWESPWGPGRPGWHIECSAMSLHYLGDNFDVHGGGDDLIFPHHENEIAQSEAYTGAEPFVRVWLHNAMVQIDREKMSKSLGNFVTLKEVRRRLPAGALRLFMLSTHYRKPLAYSPEALEEAQRAWSRLVAGKRNAVFALRGGGIGTADDLAAVADATAAAFCEALDDDLNTSGALGALFDLVRAINLALPRSDGGVGLRRAVEVLEACGNELGLWEGLSEEHAGTATTEALVQMLLDVRQRARGYRDWEVSDQIRAQLAELGIVVEDTPSGSRWRWADTGRTAGGIQ